MNRILTTAAVLLISALPAHALIGDSPTKTFSSGSNWKVGWDQRIGKSGKGVCYTEMTFTSKAKLWIGSRLDEEDRSQSWFVAIYNPAWKLTAGKYKFTFGMMGAKKSYWVELQKFEHEDKKSFLVQTITLEMANYLATDKAEQTLYLMQDVKTISRLNVGRSAAGIRQVVNCRNEILASLTANAKETPEKRREKEDDETISGSGFFVASKRVLTNFHVVRSCNRKLWVKYPSYKEVQAYVLASDPNNDLALLNTELTASGLATFSIGSRLGESAYSFGFPLSSLLSTSGNFTIGNVTALTGMGDDTRYFQVSTPVQQGNSGGPMLNDMGAVIGVTLGKLDAIKMASQTGDIPQNINFTIQSALAVNFLAINGVTPTSAANQARMEPVDIAEKAKKFTVQVYCE